MAWVIQSMDFDSNRFYPWAFRAINLGLGECILYRIGVRMDYAEEQKHPRLVYLACLHGLGLDSALTKKQPALCTKNTILSKIMPTEIKEGDCNRKCKLILDAQFLRKEIEYRRP